MLAPSTLDDSLAPAGQHVASLFCQHFPYEIECGWDVRREAAAVLEDLPGQANLVIGDLLSELHRKRSFDRALAPMVVC